MAEDKVQIIRNNCRIILPTAFGIKIIDDFIVIDFADIIDDNGQDIVEIISSFAMSKNKAKELVDSLQNVLRESTTEND